MLVCSARLYGCVVGVTNVIPQLSSDASLSCTSMRHHSFGPTVDTWGLSFRVWVVVPYHAWFQIGANIGQESIMYGSRSGDNRCGLFHYTLPHLCCGVQQDLVALHVCLYIHRSPAGKIVGIKGVFRRAASVGSHS